MTAGLSLEALIEASPTLREALRGASRAARSQSSILVLGESGTGRTTLARALHRASQRGNGPLVEMDVGVIPVSLFESELFGYRSGAFTGAERSAPGRVDLAAGGTLVFDHVEELPAAVQPKLLRLVAESVYTPIGGREKKAEVRFLAIGPEDLESRVGQGTFRADLYFRFEVLRFRLPPLRERRGELPVIATSLLADLAMRFSKPTPRLSTTALNWMAAYPWPGNLRQLRNVLERAMIVGTGHELDPAPPADSSSRRPSSLMQVEKQHILRALAYTRGHQGRAAEILGISRKALWEKRKRHEIP